MSLLVPVGLLALIALPIIIVLHMRHTKPRLLQVPTLRFWLAAEPEPVQDMRFRRPPLTVPLLLQLLLAAVVALALAQPVTSRALEALGLSGRTGPVHLILLLDGSTSMLATDAGGAGTRFDVARTSARDRLDTLREGDVATLLMMGTRLTTQGATDDASLTLLKQRLETALPAGGRADLNAALNLAHSLLLPDRDNQIVLLSDGALSVDAAVAGATGAPISLVDVSRQGDSPNVAVVDLTARSVPGNPDLFELYARVMSFAPEELTIPVSLTSGGIELDRPSITIPPNGGTVELIWPLPDGAAEATVDLLHDDALMADNQASVLLSQETASELGLSILLVSDAPDALYRVLTALPGARVTTTATASFAAATTNRGYDLVVFERFAPSGQQLEGLATPLLLVGPPPGELFPADGVILEPHLTQFRASDPLLAGVDLAGVTFGEMARYTPGTEATTVAGTGEGPLIFRTTLADSPAVVLGFDLARSNLSRRVAFPILIANAVSELAPSPLPSAIALGDPLRYRPRAEAATVEITSPTDVTVSLAVAADSSDPGGHVMSFANTGQPGHYQIAELDETGAAIGSGQFIVNAGHSRESDLRPNADLADSLALAEASGSTSQGPSRLADLWPFLVALALALLVLEWTVGLLPRWRPAVYHTPAARQ